MPVAHPASHHLKLYTERSPKVERPPIEAIGSLHGILRAFQDITGWSLRYVAGAEPKVGAESKPASERTWTAPITPGEGSPPGHLRLEPLDSASVAGAARTAMGFETARALASAIAGMLEELQKTRHVLWQREAELAAGVPLVPLSDEESHLAEKLQTTLRGAAEAVDCQAAALYLIDEGTTELKMRSCWGLPFERLMAPARAMKGELADLEALLGHAVVMENTAMMPGWKSPEDFASAVCVPVASGTMLLGTLWGRSARFYRSANTYYRDCGGKAGLGLGTRNAAARRSGRGSDEKTMDHCGTIAAKSVARHLADVGRLGYIGMGRPRTGTGRGIL